MEHRSIPMEELLPLLQLQMDHGTRAALTVTGISMLPMLRPGRDVVYLERPDRPLRTGDIILYRRKNGSYILHRIIRCDRSLICCGDNQWQPEPVEREQVIARVAAFKRNGKHRECRDRMYGVYVFLWVRLFCLRRPYIWLRRRAGNLSRRMKRNK